MLLTVAATAWSLRLHTQRMSQVFAIGLDFIGELMTRLAQPYEHSWK
jgi:hypothetical protein